MPTNNATTRIKINTIASVQQELILEVVTNIDAGACGEGNCLKRPVASFVKFCSMSMNIRKDAFGMAAQKRRTRPRRAHML
jgi:hypothetical protein